MVIYTTTHYICGWCGKSNKYGVQCPCFAKEEAESRKEFDMKNTQCESPIKALLESLQTNFANTVNPKGSLEIEQLVVNGFLAHQARKENDNVQVFTTYDGRALVYNPNKYDDASAIMETMQDLQPSEFVRWLTMVGYTVADARELLEFELGGEQTYWDTDDRAKDGKIKRFSTGFSIKWDGYEDSAMYTEFDDIGIDDHYYYVVPNGEYKWEATFETYREAKAYVATWQRRILMPW